MGGVCDIHVRK